MLHFKHYSKGYLIIFLQGFAKSINTYPSSHLGLRLSTSLLIIRPMRSSAAMQVGTGLVWREIRGGYFFLTSQTKTSNYLCIMGGGRGLATLQGLKMRLLPRVELKN